MRTSNEKLELLTIESYADVFIQHRWYTIWYESIEKVFEAVEYLNNEYGSDAIKSFKIDLNNSFVFETIWYVSKVNL